MHLAKSRCFFSKNTLGNTKAMVKKIFSIEELSKESKYLSNHLFFDRNMSKAFEDLKKKVEVKLEGWKSKLLSQAGKYTLVKSVVNAIPIYSMSANALPAKWCKDI